MIKKINKYNKKFTPIVRAGGLTPAESYLKMLCDRTFLSIWGYSNLYCKTGKELCDLLVVFGNHIIIFSDKDCQFTESEDKVSGWDKWFRRAIKKSAKQAWGAKRYIKHSPEEIFLDPKCTKKFPFLLPDVNQAKFHLIVVAHRIASHCAATFGGSGSLMIRNDIKGFPEHKEPFVIGDLNPSKSFIHVLDDTGLNILMRSCDTIADFTSYLQKKENLLRSDKTIFAAGEEELLSLYLTKVNSSGEHDFILPKDSNRIAILEGEWESFKKSPQRLAQLAEDEKSYAWDRLIEEFNKNALAGTQETIWPQSFETSEKVARFLAIPSRFMRRILAGSFLEIIKNTPADIRMLRVVQPLNFDDPYFVLLVFPYDSKYSYQRNRETRMGFLEACCLVTKLMYPNAFDIVGVATESGRMGRKGGSEDALYYNARNWTETDKKKAKELQSGLSILVNASYRQAHISEYPEPATIPSDFVNKVGRNDPCPCRSGKKYKKCHGK